MPKDRLCAFMDAILAIIMTILVLELEKPAEASWAAFWALRSDFISYAVSFFWLGAMWINLHNRWVDVQRIDYSVLWWTIIMLFFASFFPYVTSFVSEHFESLFAQVLYSAVAILVSFTNICLSRAVINANEVVGDALTSTRYVVIADLVIKFCGIVLAFLVYPPCAMFGIVISGMVMTLAPIYLNKKNSQ